MIQYIYQATLRNNDSEDEKIETKDSSEFLLYLNMFCLRNDILTVYNLTRIRNLLSYDSKLKKCRYNKPDYLLVIKKTNFNDFYKDEYIKKYGEDDFNRRTTIKTGSETRHERMIKHFYLPSQDLLFIFNYNRLDRGSRRIGDTEDDVIDMKKEIRLIENNNLIT